MSDEPKRDRAAYMREYRKSKSSQQFSTFREWFDHNVKYNKKFLNQFKKMIKEESK